MDAWRPISQMGVKLIVNTADHILIHISDNEIKKQNFIEIKAILNNMIFSML